MENLHFFQRFGTLFCIITDSFSMRWQKDVGETPLLKLLGKGAGRSFDEKAANPLARAIFYYNNRLSTNVSESSKTHQIGCS